MSMPGCDRRKARKRGQETGSSTITEIRRLAFCSCSANAGIHRFWRSHCQSPRGCATNPDGAGPAPGGEGDEGIAAWLAGTLAGFRDLSWRFGYLAQTSKPALTGMALKVQQKPESLAHGPQDLDRNHSQRTAHQ